MPPWLLVVALLVVFMPVERAPPADPAYRMEALVDASGHTTSLRERAASERLVVVVMKGTWCPVCLEQLKRFERDRERLRDLDARVVALATDDILFWSPQYSPMLLQDPGHRVVEALGLWHPSWAHPMPAIVIYDRCGAEVARIEGRRPDVIPDEQVYDALARAAATPDRCGLWQRLTSW